MAELQRFRLRFEKGITEAVWAKHLSYFEPPGADEHVLRYGLAEDAPSWVMNHFDPRRRKKHAVLMPFATAHPPWSFS